MSDSDNTPLTLLALDPIGVPPYSGRGLTQTLTPIDAAANLWRTIDGGLIDVSAPQFRKYKSTINGNDQNPPAFDDVWPGLLLQVDCIATLVYKTLGGAPLRPVVLGGSRVEGDFTIYHPRLQMRVMSFNIQEDEWGAAVGWQLDLEEI